MLPFTKRPGRNDEGDPASRDELPPVSRLVSRESANDEDMTNVVPSRGVSLAATILPAAGRAPGSVPPPSMPPRSGSSRRPSVRPIPASAGARPHMGYDVRDENANDEEGRTVVRDAPRSAKRSPAPVSSFSPAAVIRATLDGPRSRREGGLLPGPPSELLEDSSDYAPPPRSDVRAPFARTAPFEGPPSQPPPGWGGLTPAQTTQRSNSNAPVSFVPRSHPAAYVSSAPQMPAHFATPRVPYNGDPPGTAITAAHRVGRTTSSWAVALLAFGLFVGVLAVAALQGSDSVADTTASFVDPSRAPTKSAGAPPPAALPAIAPPAPSPFAAEPPPPAGSVPAGGVVGGFAAVPVPTQAPAAAPPHARVSRPPRVVAPKASTAKSASLSATEEEPPKKEAPKKRAAPDDETKKALEALQKAQLESAASF
jgi:hypothetical protein